MSYSEKIEQIRKNPKLSEEKKEKAIKQLSEQFELKERMESYCYTD